MTIQEPACVKLIRGSARKNNAPILIVRKSETNSDGSSKTRLVIDFEKLNSVSLKRTSLNPSYINAKLQTREDAFISTSAS